LDAAASALAAEVEPPVLDSNCRPAGRAAVTLR
jgi:hypothetical protein